ncbi:DUF2934 domain-containing protein [Propionivibrio limicola]|uniref:DUF2934 domain-containing protein n=1 Tax=Propionivibrio limicola TaxID=167645 RepID=UPI001B87B82B|nr:DUF2934 domain-containing protein [Propionivibrio limicola]
MAETNTKTTPQATTKATTKKPATKATTAAAEKPEPIKKAAVAKTAPAAKKAKTTTTKTATKAAKSTANGPAITDEQRYRMIAEAAYFRAESHNFLSDPVRDWIEAEKDIEARLNAAQ